MEAPLAAGTPIILAETVEMAGLQAAAVAPLGLGLAREVAGLAERVVRMLRAEAVGG